MEGDGKDAGPQAKRTKVFPEHLSFSAIANGIKTGKLVQGKVAVQRNYPYEGTVSHGTQVRLRSVVVVVRPVMSAMFCLSCWCNAR